MITVNWARVTPVIVSILIIIAIAILRQYSRTFAAVVAVMPINIPLGMWVVTAGDPQPQQALSEFSRSLLVNIIPTIFFMLAAWQMTRTGFGLLPTVVVGYLVWGVALLALFWLRGQLGG